MPRVHTSRRIPALKDGDIDHEIKLVDHSASIQGSRAFSNETDSPADDSADPTSIGQSLAESESQAPLRDNAASPAKDDNSFTESKGKRPVEGDGTSEFDRPNTPEAGPSTRPEQRSRARYENRDGDGVENGVKKTRSRSNNRRSQNRPNPSKEPETAIDILFENERGGFLCGIPLFSAAALGNLDPPAWTNAFHKPSPTSPKTAQVPDPSWEWAWPGWRVNHDDAIDADKDGWEYSLMFHRKFSWHGPKWWNSFVRRRAWIRRRVKKGIGYQANDPHLLNPEYFAVASPRKRRQSASGVSRDSTSAATCRDQIHEEDVVETKVDIETAGLLMDSLRGSRIDREKLDAVDNYLEHATDDFLTLQDYMHEIMSMFMFQASRRLLLTRLIRFHDHAANQQQQQQGGSPQLQRRVGSLTAAVRHAEEEVRRLEYWSDVKGMAENGESRGAVDGEKGWEESLDGIDKSGAAGANKEELS